ncbi:MAG: hypothetical protein IKG97_02125 [Lachnospiraceae bacterium]|nr:hypothetical protein [Lachnospiraceae bacterium]
MEEKDYMEKPLAATVLSEELAEIYEKFSERIGVKQEEEKGFLKALRSLFSDKRDTDLEVSAFYNTVGNHITKYYDALKDESPEDASALAYASVRMMLTGRENDVVSLAKISNQGFAIPLLEFLTKEQLQEMRGAYLRETPKRLLFPNQKDVLKEMDRLLAE